MPVACLCGVPWQNGGLWLILPLVDVPLIIQGVVVGLLLLRWLFELGLGRLNVNHVQAHAEAAPETLKDVMDADAYAKSVRYTLAKARLKHWTEPYDLVVLLLVLFSGILPWSYGIVPAGSVDSVWAMALYFIGFSLVLSLTSLPWDWYAQFRLEDRFGFNQSTLGLWLSDRIKGVLLALLLGVPLLALLLKLVAIGGAWWWLAGWGTVMGFQIMMMVVAPVWILPLFNKLEPLAEGDLKARLLTLGEKTGFSAQTILVMDGSKRSSHSNAFFTGFGRFRKIVLFDTLIEQLTVDELEAVLAHEIGHYKRRHVLKMLAWSCATLLVGFGVLAWLLNYQPFFSAFGFGESRSVVVGFLLFTLLSGAVTFWTTPLSSAWSRKFEFEADAFAAHAVGGGGPLIGALKKLSEKNLSNLTPHPWYSRFYYSHPTLHERIANLPSS